MAFAPQEHASILDRLPNEILQHILDFAMTRDSPFYIDDPIRGDNRTRKRHSRPNILRSSTGTKDPLFIGFEDDAPMHQHDPQSVHRTDWIAINSTSRRIRALGRLSFFRAKRIAMHAELPALLQRNDLKYTKRKCMRLDDQRLALSYIQDIVIVDAKKSPPAVFIELPRTLAAFPCLRRCTLLFGYGTRAGSGHNVECSCPEHDVEWITLALALASPVPLELQELMTGVGMPTNIRLEEALGPNFNWPNVGWVLLNIEHEKARIKGATDMREKSNDIIKANLDVQVCEARENLAYFEECLQECSIGFNMTWVMHWNCLARFVYPMMRIKAELLRAKEEGEEKVD